MMCLLCVTETTLSQSSSDTKVVERSKLYLYVICKGAAQALNAII